MSSPVDKTYARIKVILKEARAAVVRTVNVAMVKAYWLIGREIVEIQQQGDSRAEYSESLLETISLRLQPEFGRGFTLTNIKYMRMFYLAYPGLLDEQNRHAVHGQFSFPKKRHAARDELINVGRLNPNLSWTHYGLLVGVESPEAKSFYEIETTKNRWSSRELERQINSLLYERLAKSRDKKGVMALAARGHEIQEPEDIIKDPVVIEFVGMPESTRLVETDLEEALLTNLQKFLLELGKGFAFIERQQRLTLDGDHFYVDLVFYHTILKCFVLVDLKVQKLTHADLGQMQLYVNYYDEHQRSVDGNPTLGLILCTDKNDAMVKYTLGKANRRIFASRYKLHFPSESELAAEIRRELSEVEQLLPKKTP